MTSIDTQPNTVLFQVIRQQILLNIYPPSPISNIVPQVWAMITLQLIVIVIYIVILSYKTYRVYKGKEDFWLFRKTTRINGSYILPNSIWIWSLGTLIYSPLIILYLYARIAGRYPWAWMQVLTTSVAGACLSASGWVSMCTVLYTALATLDTVTTNRRKFLTGFTRLPSPTVMHLLFYALPVIWAVCFLSTGGLAASRVRHLESIANGVVTNLDALIDGTATPATALAMSEGLNLLQTAAISTADSVHTNVIMECVVGVTIITLYLPYTLVFLYQIHTLQRNQVRLRTTTTNNTATHEYNSRLRYQTYLIMAQVVLLLALAVSQIAPGVYIAAVEHQGPPSRTDEIMRTLLIGWSSGSLMLAIAIGIGLRTFGIGWLHGGASDSNTASKLTQVVSVKDKQSSDHTKTRLTEWGEEVPIHAPVPEMRVTNLYGSQMERDMAHLDVTVDVESQPAVSPARPPPPDHLGGSHLTLPIEDRPFSSVLRSDSTYEPAC